jgi:hypothetical protein
VGKYYRDWPSAGICTSITLKFTFREAQALLDKLPLISLCKQECRFSAEQLYLLLMSLALAESVQLVKNSYISLEMLWRRCCEQERRINLPKACDRLNFLVYCLLVKIDGVVIILRSVTDL